MISTVFTLSSDIDADADAVLQHTGRNNLQEEEELQQQPNKKQTISGSKRLRESMVMMTQNDDDDNDGGNQLTSGAVAVPSSQKIVTLVFEEKCDDPSKKIFRKVFQKTSPRGLARFYRLAGGSVTTPYKVDGSTASGKPKLVRNGLQTWRNRFGDVVRTRTFVNGVCSGEEVISCQLIEKRELAFQIPMRFTWVEAGTAMVCKRNWTNGVLNGPCVQVEAIPICAPHTSENVRYAIGKTETLTHYVGGVKHGTELRCYINARAKVLYQCDWQAGKKSGYEVLNYRNGRKAFEAMFVDGVCDAASRKSYYRNGTVRSSAIVEEKAATVSCWSNDGKLQRRYSLSNQLLLQKNASDNTNWRQSKLLKHGKETATATDGSQIVMWWYLGKRVQEDGISLFNWSQAAKNQSRRRSKRAKN